MKYFTPELYVSYQSDQDSVAEQAEQLWEQAADRYTDQLQSVLPQAPEGVRQLYGTYSLHDADLLTMGQQGDRFVLVVRLDPPCRDLVLTYTITEEPFIDRSALPARYCSAQPLWLYDEVELSTESGVCEQSILLSNGWELRLRFTHLQVISFRSLLLTETERQRTAAGPLLEAFLTEKEHCNVSVP